MHEIVVISGKGGTGKTSITAALAALGPKKVMADCDVDAADLHLILDPTIQATHNFISGEIASIDPNSCVSCGLCREKCRFEAISPDFEVLPEFCEGCGVCHYVCTAEAVIMSPRLCGQWFVSQTRFGSMVHARLGIGEENSGKLVTTVRNKSGELAKEQGIEVILTDGPPGIGCPVIASLTNASLALVVTEPTLSAVHDLERVIQLARHFDIPAQVVINKADVNKDLVLEIHAQCRRLNAEVIGEFQYDPAFTQAQIAGKSIVEYDDQRFSPAIEQLWERMLERLNISQEAKET